MKNGLVGMKMLRKLDVSYCEGVDDEYLEGICELVNLESLNLCGCGVTDVGIARVLDSLKNLVCLDLRECKGVGDGGPFYVGCMNCIWGVLVWGLVVCCLV